MFRIQFKYHAKHHGSMYKRTRASVMWFERAMYFDAESRVFRKVFCVALNGVNLPVNFGLNDASFRLNVVRFILNAGIVALDIRMSKCLICNWLQAVFRDWCQDGIDWWRRYAHVKPESVWANKFAAGSGGWEEFTMVVRHLTRYGAFVKWIFPCKMSQFLSKFRCRRRPRRRREKQKIEFHCHFAAVVDVWRVRTEI